MRRWLQLVVLLSVLAWIGGWATGQIHSTRDKSKVEKTKEELRTVCVGRYLVDVPVEAHVSFSGGVLDGFSVDSLAESKTEFLQRIVAREAEIAARNTVSDGSGGMLEARELHVVGMTGRTFVFGLNRAYWFENGRRVDDEWVAVEIHANTEGISVSLTAKAVDMARIASGEALLARLQVRRPDDIQSAPGFCMGRVVFVEPLPVHKNEHTVMHLGLPLHPELHMTLVSIGGGPPETSLLARVRQAEADMSADVLLRMSKLRERKRSINGNEGEEVLVRARELNFRTPYGFSWDAAGAEGDLLHPYLSLELQTGNSATPSGKPVDTSLHEDALLALWDRIASSIRPRNADTTSRRPNPALADPRQPAAL